MVCIWLYAGNSEYPALLIVNVRRGVYDSDNVTGADNQQERLDSYIAGNVDGEGSVIPFFERTPLLSAKHADFEKFATIVRELALGNHRTPAGFRRLLELAVSMNGGGRYRQVRWIELVALQNPQRLHARQG